MESTYLHAARSSEKPQQRTFGHEYAVLPPWLVFTLQNCKKSSTFFNVSEGSYKVSSIPEMRRTYFIASYHGWLVLSYNKRNMFLLNPVSRQKIHLPNLDRGFCICHILLSSPPTDPDCVIIFFCCLRQSFIYCHPSAEKWIEGKYKIEEVQDHGPIKNIVYCNGKLYVYTLLRQLGAVDFDADPMVTWLRTRGPKMPPAVTSNFLVESFGEIFLVQRIHDLFSPNFLEFAVYKMNFARTDWERVDTLGDHVLFLGVRCFTSCSATDTGMERDCIYFTKGNDRSLYVYHLDRGTISVDLPCPNVRPPWTDPIWLMPIAGEGYAFEQTKQGGLQLDLNNTEREISSQTEKEDMLELARTEKEEVAEHVSWLDLPIHILELIALQLFRADFIHLTCVCKMWNSIDRPNQIINRHFSLHPNDELPLLKNHTPWLMFFSKDDGNYKFLDPIYNETYSINVPKLSGASLCFSKDGWVFMHRWHRSVFLFNPFINEKIKLPSLEFQICFDYISFSSTPTASECIIFAVTYCSSNHLKFHTCRRGDKSWTEYHSFSEQQFLASFANPVFYGDVFYILGHDGRLGVYDPKRSTCTILTKPKPLKFCDCKNDVLCNWKNYLVESRGKLLMVFVGFLGSPIHIFSLDFSTMEWVEVEALEDDQMLLVGRQTSLASASVAKGMGNKIYFPMVSAQKSVFYSHEDGKCHPNSDFRKSEEFIYSTWVEPTWSKPSAKELKWKEC
ncbi:hypothetical protein ACLOJK_019271 [Asimina triloba]